MSAAGITGRKRRTGIIVAVAVIGGLLMVTGGVFVGTRILGGGAGDGWAAMERLGGQGCFNRTKGDGEGTAVPEGLESVPCTAPHDAEMMFRQGKDDADMPADYGHPVVRKMFASAGDACAFAAIRELADPMTVPANAQLRWYLPTEQQYAAGHRGMYCYYAFDGNLPTRTVRYVPDGLTNDQMRFPASAARLHFYEAIAFRKGDFPARQQAAYKVLDEIAQRQTIYGMGFETARPQVDALLAEDADRQEQWHAATRATDESAFDAILTRLGNAGPTTAELAVRAAIGLPTAQGDPITE